MQISLPTKLRSILVVIATILLIFVSNAAPGIADSRVKEAGDSIVLKTKMPYDPRPNFQDYAKRNQYDQFAWDLFLYINWPAKDGERGIPDPNKDLSDRGSTTWETWKDLRETFRYDGLEPTKWNTPISETPNVKQFYNIDQIDGYHLMDRKNPPQPVLFGLRLNRPTFEYLVDRELYNKEGQLAFFDDATAPPMNFSSDAMEVKSTWITLDDTLCNQNRCPYHVANYCDESGICQRMGLTGLHVMSKVQDNWFWATLEQVDNQTTTQAPETQTISDNTQRVNQQMHRKLLGTDWENYVLRGSQWSFTDKNNQPILLSNTEIETRFQNSSSCMTCHALASRGAASDGYISFFKMSPTGVEGYIGDAPWQLFCKSGSATPQGSDEPHGELFCKKYGEDYRYKFTDYVWSMRLANRLKKTGQ